MPATPVARVSPAAHRAHANQKETTESVKYPMKQTLRTVVLIGMTALLTGCPQTKEKLGLGETLKQYEVTIRWAQWDAAINFIAPQYQREHPITRLELDRLRLFRVTQYVTRSSVSVDDGTGLKQIVEIKMFNKNQARERTITYEQYWKYDAPTKRWLLHSDLPDPTQRNY